MAVRLLSSLVAKLIVHMHNVVTSITITHSCVHVQVSCITSYCGDGWLVSILYREMLYINIKMNLYFTWATICHNSDYSSTIIEPSDKSRLFSATNNFSVVIILNITNYFACTYTQECVIVMEVSTFYVR